MTPNMNPSTMNQREVVDLLSSSSAADNMNSSSSSSSSGLPGGLDLNVKRPLGSGLSLQDDVTGQAQDFCDDNSSISSMDASFVQCENIDDCMQQSVMPIHDIDNDGDSSAIEILSIPSHKRNDDSDCSSSSSSGVPSPSMIANNFQCTNKIDDLKKQSTLVANAINEEPIPITNNTTKRKNTKRRAWGKNKSSKTNNTLANDKTTSTTTTITTASIPRKNIATFFHCYLLRSLDPDHPLKTYIGFTTHPSRRIRQHNGILKNGGARRTKRSGRPWTFCCIVGGFDSKVSALQFEWAWQNVGRSKAFREGLGGNDAMAKKMGRRRGVKARLEEMRVLLNMCKPWCELEGFTVYFMEESIHVQFCELLSKAGDDGNSRKGVLEKQVCSVEDMPFALDLKSKKKRGQKDAVVSNGSTLDCDTSALADSSDLKEPSKRKSISEERSRPSGSPEIGEADVNGLDFQNLSLDRRYSWEDLSLSDCRTNSDDSANDEEQENKSTSINKPDVSVCDLCDSP